jgi:glutamate-1-semialdehyde aminotransferase
MTFFAGNAAGSGLAGAICETMPCAERLRHVSTGGEAGIYAMRLAWALRERCGRHGIVPILDAVVTGFRFARGGARQRCGAPPDLCMPGTIVGGGLPLAAFAGRAAIIARSDRALVRVRCCPDVPAADGEKARRSTRFLPGRGSSGPVAGSTPISR